MPAHGPPSPTVQPAKRQRQNSLDYGSLPSEERTSPGDQQILDGGGVAAGALGKAGQSTNFRNVSACNRCRLRKNRCDQKLPSCASCMKAKVPCVGYDPTTKKEIPRSYVFYLETRIELLENLLNANQISFPPADDLDSCSRPGTDYPATTPTTEKSVFLGQQDVDGRGMTRPQPREVDPLNPKKQNNSPAMMNISSKPRSLASASGVSFARVVFAAVQHSVSDQNGTSERAAGPRNVAGGGTSMRDSFFGLHTKPTILPAPFPSREVGLRLVTLYFEHANPQIPILHRGEFMAMFERAYQSPLQARGARELYMLNMVFAIGCGVILGEPVKIEEPDDTKMDLDRSKDQAQPEEYHASAIVHLESCLSNSGGGLEVLQAVLLLANFALLRPVPPGLWYIIGVAVRLAVDLGLHNEDTGEVESRGPDTTDADQSGGQGRREGSGQDRGKRLWNRDMRRRLWWCTYSFDRLVSACVGRPFGISDQVITTELPSLLDDDCITTAGIMNPQQDAASYKHVAHHYFRLRILQSEILQVLQHNQAQIARAGQTPMYPEMSLYSPSPFLVRFDSFRSWRMDIDQRLLEWKNEAPTKLDIGVAFSTEFLELNYWQAILMLYRQSLSVPSMFEGEYNTSNEVNSPKAFMAELREDEDKIYLKVAEAGQKILRIYRQLHLSSLVSYTYLSTHHLFMAGISYLYAIWHSPVVRSRLTMDEVDFTVLAAKSVFQDMIDKCPPAETCRDAFDRTARATIKMASSNGGFGPAAYTAPRQRASSVYWGGTSDSAVHTPQATRHRQRPSEQKPFTFDLSLSDTLSSPTLSQTEAMAKPSPPMSRQTYDSDYVGSQSRPSQSPADAGQPVDPALVPSPSAPPPPRRVVSSGSAYMNQQFGVQPGPPPAAAAAAAAAAEYPDNQTMEFLQNLGQSQNGEFGNLDQSQVDLGFGINWEGLPNEYGEAQQMNPFDSFFFGGQQGGSGGGPGGGMGL